MKKPRTKAAFGAEYARLYVWRDRWTRLANPRDRMLNMSYVQERAMRANRKLAELVCKFDAAGFDQEMPKATVNLEVIKAAYGWTIDIHGEVHGLLNGDMGYEGTGIQLEGDTLAIWNLGVAAWKKEK